MFSKTSIIVLHLSRLHYRTLVFPPPLPSPQPFFRRLSLCNLPSNASSRDHSRDPFFHEGVKKHPRGAIIPLRKPPLIPGERIHAFWQRYFSRQILSFVSFSKSHISPSYLISSESLPDGRDCHFDFDC